MTAAVATPTVSPLAAPHHVALRQVDTESPAWSRPATTNTQSTAPRQAAVSILDLHHSGQRGPVVGLARFLHVPATSSPASTIGSDTDKASVVVDISVNVSKPVDGIPLPATTPSEEAPQATRYTAYIASTGNMIDPPATTGASWLPLGEITLDNSGAGRLKTAIIADGPRTFLSAWVGRACVLEPMNPASSAPEYRHAFAGVVAHSSGNWDGISDDDQSKTVCECSGRTVWSECRGNL